jgi:uncharacterized membrane protein
VLGVGFAALIDGIVLHQTLQWHHMLTDAGESAGTVDGLEANTLADGLFHMVALVITAAGIVILAGAPPGGRSWSRRMLAGGLLTGAGGFNLLEGVVDHHLLGIHHVRDDVATKWPWDLGFLAVNALVLAAGVLLTRRALRDADGRAATTPTRAPVSAGR